MDIKTSIGIVAALIALAGTLRYVKEIVAPAKRSERVKPRLAAWGILVAESIILLPGTYIAGGHKTIYLLGAYAIIQLLIFLLAFKYGEKGFTLLEKVCLTIAAVSILIWIIQGDPTTSIVINVIIDACGVAPIMMNALKGDEDTPAWVFAAVSAILNLFAITETNLGAILFPVYLAASNTIIMAFAWLGRRRLRAAQR